MPDLMNEPVHVCAAHHAEATSGDDDQPCVFCERDEARADDNAKVLLIAALVHRLGGDVSLKSEEMDAFKDGARRLSISAPDFRHGTRLRIKRVRAADEAKDE